VPDRSRALAVVGTVTVVAGVALHGAAGSRLWVHMTQHLLFVLVAAPLLGLALLRRLPPPVGWGPVAGWTVAHSVALWAWHLPGPFDAAVRSEPLHGLEHLCLLGTGVGFWWVVLATTARAPAIGIGAVFVVAMQGIALGGLMTLASRPWYAGYRLDDQQIAGVLMWCPAGFAYCGVAVAMLYRWLADREGVPV
jgi:putative membrane protein